MTDDHPGDAAPDAPGAPVRRAPLTRFRAGLSIRSVLLIMMLSTSIVSTIVVGAIGYNNGTSSLREAAFGKLAQVRNSRAAELRTLVDSMRSSLAVTAHGASVVDATRRFSTAFASLDDSTLSASQTSALSDWFGTTWAPKLAKATGETVDPNTFVPLTAAERYLQAKYVAGLAVPSAPLGDWDATNAQYDRYFARMDELLGFGDSLLIDVDGNIVYTADKGIDLGSNLLRGPFRRSLLAGAWSTAMTSNLPDQVMVTDFERYSPALDVPTGWAVAPVSDGGTVIGALAVRLPTDRIDAVMTGSGNWKQDGLGDTGEVYLVGDDQLLRSPSRDLVQHPSRYRQDALRSGLSPVTVSRVVASGNPVLVQPARTEAVTDALEGRTGTIDTAGYLGGSTISAYAPLSIDGVHWAIVAQVDTAEAYARSSDFARNLIISLAIIVLVVCVAALLLAQILVVPLRRLRVAARRIAAGDLTARVDAGSNDELAELGAAFNDMAASLAAKDELLTSKQNQHDSLLRSMMPESVAKQYLAGEPTIAQDHREVTVLYADILGFEEYAASLDSEHALAQLNELVRSFDDAADKEGVERVRSTRRGYFASCGLIVPRVDSARRMVAFAIEIQRILDRHGAQEGVSLALRAGIDTGTVTAGLVGTSRVIYDLWGDAVTLAYRMHSDATDGGIILSSRVLDRMPDTVTTTDAGTIHTSDGEERIARIDLKATTSV